MCRTQSRRSHDIIPRGGYPLDGDPVLSDIALVNAVAKGEIKPVFQPVIDVHQGQMSGVEVLARWPQPDGTQVPPDVFIPQAMACGQIVPLTLKLMSQVKVILETIEPLLLTTLTVGFNVEQACLHSRSFEAACREFIEDSSLKRVRLALEVTEREPATLEAVAMLDSLREKGACVVLDDYGTGYAREAVLPVLRPDIVKTDRSLTALAGRGDPQGILTRCLETLESYPGVTILAEGVETEEEKAWLQGQGVALMQGYGLCPPLGREGFVDLLHRPA